MLNPSNSDSLNGYIHMKLGWQYYPDGGNDSAGAFHYRQCLKLSDNPRHLGRSAFFMNMIHERSMDSAIHYFKIAEAYQEQTQDTAYLFHLYRNVSLVYQDHGYFQSAVDNLLKALSLAEAKEDQEQLADTYITLSNLFHDFEDFEEGKKYARYAMELTRSLPPEYWPYQRDALNVMAINFDDNQEFDSALYYHKLTENLILENNSQATLDRTLNNIGNTLKKMGRVGPALTYFLRSYDIIKQIDSPIIHYHKATVFTNLADIASLQGRQNAAYMYLDSAENNALTSDNYEKIRDLYQMKYLVNKRFGQTEAALTNLEKHLRLRDSVLDERNARLVKDLEVAYRTEKKEKENAKLQAVTAEQDLALNAARNRMLFIALTAGLLLLLAGFGYNGLRLKRKAEKAAAEEELQKIRFQSVIETEERERMRIAQDLHDGLGQILATAKLNVASLEGDQKGNEEEELITRSMHLLDESITELRAISHAMMPEVLRHKGLQPALHELAENINLSMQVQVLLQADEEVFERDKTRQSSLYRVIQEVINNMLKHSGATRIHLLLRRAGAGVELSISDNGKGFDTASIEKGRGLGWSNIFSRIRLMNGTVDVKSSPSGTTVYIKIPLEEV
ncbi:MAG TPA: hypothetical protein DCG19_09015 [Cryomorphaceae bacterium]|nr:hypothetical protein [Owenweeksia sp.]HAD97534.1 hypothetical protein [Cryomorphaceae bacterium]HBF19263.1 hypothetical protein [Cryomorphaceae bacterium]